MSRSKMVVLLLCMVPVSYLSIISAGVWARSINKRVYKSGLQDTVIGILPNVTVSDKSRRKPNARKIINKVNKQFAQNYGDLSFDQSFNSYSVTSNYDTVKSKMNEQLGLHFYRDEKKMKARKWIEDTVTHDAAFVNGIGLPNLVLGDVIPRADIIRKGMVIGDKQSDNFDFKLLAHYTDKNEGPVYRISFKPKKDDTYNDFFLRGIINLNMPLGYLKGEMIIREEDHAVLSLKYILELQVERFNVALQGIYQSPGWKTSRMGKIISSSRVYKYDYTYTKDAATGKYFVQTIKAECYDTGYQIENQRQMHLSYQFNLASAGITNIVE